MTLLMFIDPVLFRADSQERGEAVRVLDRDPQPVLAKSGRIARNEEYVRQYHLCVIIIASSLFGGTEAAKESLAPIRPPFEPQKSATPGQWWGRGAVHDLGEY
jgi:hypothetical protein